MKCVDHTVFHDIQIAAHNNTVAPKILILSDLALCSIYTGTSKVVISGNFSYTKLTCQAPTLIFMKHMSASYCRIALKQKSKSELSGGRHFLSSCFTFYCNCIVKLRLFQLLGKEVVLLYFMCAML